MNPARDIIVTFKALASAHRLGVVLCLASGVQHADGLMQALDFNKGLCQATTQKLRHAGLIYVKRVHGVTYYHLSDHIQVFEDKLVFDASGLEITIARALKEAS